MKKPNGSDIESKIIVCEVCNIQVQGYTNLMRHRETPEHKQKLVKFMREKMRKR